MLTEVDVRTHAAEGDMLAVVFAGTYRVESFIVGLYQIVSACGVFPYPFTESVLDGLLLLLSQGRFFLIQDALFLAVFILNNIIYADIAEIERIFQNVIRIRTRGAISDIGSYVVLGNRVLSGNMPLCGVLRKADFDTALQASRSTGWAAFRAVTLGVKAES